MGLLLLMLSVIPTKFKRFVQKINSRVSFSLSNMRIRKQNIWKTDFTCFTSKVSISWCLSISFRLTNHESNDFYSLFPYPLFVFMNLFDFFLLLFQLFSFLSNNILDVFWMSFLFLTNFNSTHLIIVILFRKISSNKYKKKFHFNWKNSVIIQVVPLTCAAVWGKRRKYYVKIKTE